jgi:type I restriction enzyme S subunit
MITDRGRFKPYPEYKDSGVEWLGKIPKHWEVIRLKQLCGVVNGSTPRSEVADYWDGHIVWITPEDLGQLDSPGIGASQKRITIAGYRSCGTSLVPAGSIILSTRAPIGHLGIATTAVCTNQGCRSLVFRDPWRSDEKFFYYQLLAARKELQSRGQGSTFRELSKQNLEKIPLAVMTHSEQVLLRVFLDKETAKIDALIAKKRRLIELLQSAPPSLPALSPRASIRMSP